MDILLLFCVAIFPGCFLIALLTFERASLDSARSSPKTCLRTTTLHQASTRTFRLLSSSIFANVVYQLTSASTGPPLRFFYTLVLTVACKNVGWYRERKTNFRCQLGPTLWRAKPTPLPFAINLMNHYDCKGFHTISLHVWEGRTKPNKKWATYVVMHARCSARVPRLDPWLHCKGTRQRTAAAPSLSVFHWLPYIRCQAPWGLDSHGKSCLYIYIHTHAALQFCS